MSSDNKTWHIYSTGCTPLLNRFFWLYFYFLLSRTWKRECFVLVYQIPDFKFPPNLYCKFSRFCFYLFLLLYLSLPDKREPTKSKGFQKMKQANILGISYVTAWQELFSFWQFVFFLKKKAKILYILRWLHSLSN